MSMDEKAIEARRQYQREWRKKNPEKAKAIAERYWTKKAKQLEDTKLESEKIDPVTAEQIDEMWVDPSDMKPVELESAQLSDMKPVELDPVDPDDSPKD